MTTLQLPEPKVLSMPLGEALQKRRTNRDCTDAALSDDEIAALLGSVVFNNSGCHGFFLLSQLSPVEPRNWMMVTISTSTNSTMAMALA